VTLDAPLCQPGKPREVDELIVLLRSPRAGCPDSVLINADGGTTF